MNPSILYFSRLRQMVKALFFLGVALLGFAAAHAMHAERTRPPAPVALPGGLILPAPAPRQSPLGPIGIVVAVVAGCTALFYSGRHGARSFSRGIAVQLKGGKLHFHPSYGDLGGPLPVEGVATMRFDRADRLAAADVPLSARLAMRLHRALLIEYVRRGDAVPILLVATDFDGGVEQLRRFAHYVESHRAAASRPAANR